MGSDPPADEIGPDEPTEEVEPAVAEVEVPWQQLHPASMAVNLVPRAWRVVRGAWPLFLALFYGGSADQTGLVDIGILLLFFLMTAGSTVVHWWTLRYRVHRGRLEIRSGLLNRQTRVIDPSRVQNVETVRNVFQRAAGLVEVRIETASGTEIEGLLSALSVEQADELVQALKEARAAAGAETEEPEDERGDTVVANDLSELMRYGATATRFGAGALVVFGLGVEATQFLDPREVEEVGGFLSGVGLVLVGVGVLTGTWLVGTGTAVIRHYGFRLAQLGHRLVATQGLFTQRRVELRFDKIQLVSVRQPWLRRLFGFGSVHIETAAVREGEGGTVSAEAMAPVVFDEQFAAVLERVLPGARAELWDAELNPPHANALKRGLIGGAIRAGLLAAALSWWFFPWGLLSLVFVPISLVTAWLDHRYQGWLVTDDIVLARQGYLDRRTTIVPRSKLQSLEVRQGLFRRRWEIGRIVVRVAGSSVSLPDLGWEQALDLQRELLPRRQAA